MFFTRSLLSGLFHSTEYFLKKNIRVIAYLKKVSIFAPVIETTIQKLHDGAIAQLVEQRTENPCVPGSIPGGTTFKRLQIW